MKSFIRFSYTTAQLFHRKQTTDFFIRYNTFQPKESFKILNFSHKTPKYFFPLSIFVDNKLPPLFQLYLKFLQKNTDAPQAIAFQFLEENFRKRILDELKKSNTNVKTLKCQILKSSLLQKTEIIGLFLHRKFNLNYDSYSIHIKRPDYVHCELKKTMRSEALRLYQKTIREYQKDKMAQVYHKKFTNFIQQTSIFRYIYETEVDLQLAIEKEGKQNILGKEGPSKHLIQVQSFFSPYSNTEECYLTDVDFLMKGNSFFREL